MEDDITTGLTVLQSHLDGMLNRVQQNSLTLRRLQQFEMRLLALNTLTEVIEFILIGIKDLFNLDVVSLSLLDPKQDILACLLDDNNQYQTWEGLLLTQDESLFKHHFGFSNKPSLGLYRIEKHEKFFASQSNPASVILAPIIRRDKCLGSLNLGSFNSDRFLCNMSTDFVEHLASVVGICLENIFNYETMRKTSLVDPLTGVNNRRFLEQRIEEELDRCQRSREPLSCLFLDIDFFKRINDGHGHQAGDFVLAEVAGTIKKQLRSNDVLSRYGGEEFVALLSQSDESQARDIAERIRRAVEDLPIAFNDCEIPVTISIGAATFIPRSGKIRVNDVAGELIQAADTALYQAKHHGRNQVVSQGVIPGLEVDEVNYTLGMR